MLFLLCLWFQCSKSDVSRWNQRVTTYWETRCVSAILDRFRRGSGPNPLDHVLGDEQEPRDRCGSTIELLGSSVAVKPLVTYHSVFIFLKYIFIAILSVCNSQC